METDYPFKQHDIVPPEDLTLEKARALAQVDPIIRTAVRLK